MRETAQESGENFAPLSKNALKTIFTRFRAARITSQSIITEKEAIRAVGGPKRGLYSCSLSCLCSGNGKNEVNPGPLPRENDIEYHGCSRPPIARNGKNEVYPVSKFVTCRFTRASHSASGGRSAWWPQVSSRGRTEDFSARDVLVKIGIVGQIFLGP